MGPQKVCETYTKYKDDVALMKGLNFNSFRTSIQWSRLIADFETGEPDADAVRFYHAYLDEMIANGIEPMINLYHFDMPEVLQKNMAVLNQRKSPTCSPVLHRPRSPCSAIK